MQIILLSRTRKYVHGTARTIMQDLGFYHNLCRARRTRQFAIVVSVIAIILLLYSLTRHSVLVTAGVCTLLQRPTMTPPTRMPCSEAAIVKNAEFLAKSSTRCPSEPWYWEWQSLLVVNNPKKVGVTYIEVGCNKASDAC